MDPSIVNSNVESNNFTPKYGIDERLQDIVQFNKKLDKLIKNNSLTEHEIKARKSHILTADPTTRLFYKLPENKKDYEWICILCKAPKNGSSIGLVWKHHSECAQSDA